MVYMTHSNSMKSESPETKQIIDSFGPAEDGERHPRDKKDGQKEYRTMKWPS